MLIKQAYGKNFEKYDVSPNGYSSEDNSEFQPDIEWHPSVHYWWRPTALQGLEDNRGWVTITEGINEISEEGVAYLLFNADTKSHTVFKEGEVFDLSDYTHYKVFKFGLDPLY